MSWRVIAHGDEVWHVDAGAERRANTAAWQLVLSFRSATPRHPERDKTRAWGSEGGRGQGGRPSFWTTYPLEATSKASLFIQAERISDAALTQLLVERTA
ncbi:MAG: hypothetical protein ACREMN_04015 [Gemmatimonadales bacterium]